MLLKQRPSRIEVDPPVATGPGFDHLDSGSLATLRWLKENRIEFVLTGSVAEAVHSRSTTHGPVVIVPAPYRRNLDRLARALRAVGARVRDERSAADVPSPPAHVTVESLSSRKLWAFACGSQRIDVVGTGTPATGGSSGASGYQELLYEANRAEIGPGLTVEVASPEDIEHYAHMRRTGTAPKITISRQSEVPAADSGPAPTTAPGPDSSPGSG
jgi:hypothetical protein